MNKIIAWIGLILSITAIFSAIFFEFHFWYGFLLIGSFLFFDCLNEKNSKKSILKNFSKMNKSFLIYAYLIGFSISLLLDYVFGQLIGANWFYRHGSDFLNFVFPAMIYYPIGALSVYAFYNFIAFFIEKKFKGSFWKLNLSLKAKNKINNFLLGILFLSIIFPLMNFLFNNNLNANYFTAVLMIANIFTFDPVYFHLTKKSLFFFKLIEGSKKTIISLLASLPLLVLMHEYPNVFAGEWVYQNVAFLGEKIFGIPLIVAGFGWIFIITFSVSFIETMLFYHSKKKK